MSAPVPAGAAVGPPPSRSAATPGWRADLVASRADLVIAGIVFAGVTGALLLDSSGSLWLQRMIGGVTWLVLLAVLRRESSLVRCQVAVVVVIATAVEYTFSPWLEVYVYRFENVPAYVPPGHGLVYLCALALGRTALARRWSTPLIVATLTAGGAYALWGLVGSSRLDVLGAIWFGCLVGFLRWGPSRMLYVGAFAIVTYLEWLGTAVQTWAWQPLDPTGLVPIGNPPSGAAGGYAWFDLAALLTGPTVLAWVHRSRSWRPAWWSPRPAPDAIPHAIPRATLRPTPHPMPQPASDT